MPEPRSRSKTHIRRDTVMHPGIVAHGNRPWHRSLRSRAIDGRFSGVDLLIQRDAVPAVCRPHRCASPAAIHEPCPQRADSTPPPPASDPDRDLPPACATLTASGSGLAPAKRRFRPISDNGALVAHGRDSRPVCRRRRPSLGHLTPTVVHTSSADRIGDGDLRPATGSSPTPRPWPAHPGTEKVNPSPGRLIHERSRPPPGSLFPAPPALPGRNAHQVRVRRPGYARQPASASRFRATNVGHRGVWVTVHVATAQS